LSNDVNIEMERLRDQSVPALAYDGGSIRVPMEFHDETVVWFTKHMGWIIQHQFDDISKDESNPVIRDRKTVLGFGTCIHSMDYRDKVEPLHKDLSIETYVRWCWRTRDLRATRTYLQQEGVKVSEPYRGPGDTDYFDFWATDQNILLTSQEDVEVGEDAPRLVPSWTRIGVGNLQSAKGWYETYVGMRLIEDHSSNGYLIMGLDLEHHPDKDSQWVLEEASEERSTLRFNGAARPNCVLHDRNQFAAYHAFLKNQGVETSEIIGYPPIEGFSWFHFYDPNGNRFDVVCY
jgi:catechol 2,3-dioxygenase-like lactoylglutathione lyase family enzyme